MSSQVIPEPSLIDEDRKRVGAVQWTPTARSADGRTLAAHPPLASAHFQAAPVGLQASLPVFDPSPHISSPENLMPSARVSPIFQKPFVPMCTAYNLGRQRSNTASDGIGEDLASLLESLGHSLVRPTLLAPVILPDSSLELMRWGFRRRFAAKRPGGKPTQRTIVNSREDKLESPMWRDAFHHRRCLIPAAAYFEWVSRDGPMVPFRFARPEPTWLHIAGIWEEVEDGSRCFSMITTEPSPAIARIHDRMPAVLTDEQVLPYLQGRLGHFGPSSVPLTFLEAPNFLKPDSLQGELF